ncbi:MAG TPA: nucleotidyltransferase family protein, partial [Acidimicrobiales bacterium]|nr:nucleotidyltransferase family protein [Acidimicrobiales bacterium]
MTAEVVAAMGAAGIETILLKGPSIARWLYPEGGRTYGDTDLLVAPGEFEHAEEVLRALGFVDAYEGFHPFELGMYAPGLPVRVESRLVRQAGAGRGPAGAVEPHRNLPRLPIGDEVLWAEFNADTQPMSVGGVQVRVLGRTALAFHVVLHAVQHGFGGHTAEDLRRAV